MEDINRNLSRLQLFPDYDTTPMSLEDINEMTTTKALMHCEAVLKELIKVCNLNTEDTNKIKEEWNELITASEDEKNVRKQLEYLINNYNLDMATEEEIYKLFDLENPSTDDSNDYATNPDIDNIFK